MRRPALHHVLALLLALALLTACRALIDDEARAPLEPTVSPEEQATLVTIPGQPAIVAPLGELIGVTPTPGPTAQAEGGSP